MKEVKPGTKFTDEGWIDVEKVKVVPDARFEHLVGIIVDETGAGNIGNIDRFLEYVNGHKVRISIEVIDMAENRPETTKVPPPTPIEYGVEYCAKCGKRIQ
ncbi:hypothetical protein KAU33_16050 [Candidatus Dependentiae bacterium]|nr:hypothetical protein [Candidatus Dependentiae bacterium]